MNNVDLVILCGGKGSRLKNLTKNIPKPLLKINKTTFLDKIIQKYQRLNFNKIYFLAGFRGEKIRKRYHNKIINSIPCEVIVEKTPLGTAGCLYLIKNKVKNKFILVNADSYIDYDQIKFLNFNNKKFIGKILLTKNLNYLENKKLSNLNIKNKVVFLNKKSGKIMNAGVYLFNKKIFNFIKKKFVSLENEVLPELIKRRKLCGQISKGKFIDIGILKNYNIAKNKFFKKNEAIFLDRDGVINEDFGYVIKYEDFKWTKGIFEVLRYINKKQKRLFIITNQSGIGRGYYTEKDFLNLHKKIKLILIKKNIYIDDVFYCPHHPKYGLGLYKKNCQCRKPKNLLLKKAISNWNIDKNKSFMIGDQVSDMICAKKSKIKFFYKKKDFFSQIKEII